ncbi:MAG: DUF1186 domain-containing protein [Candidatus Methanoperedens sp.]|nr:DUF1186 domain-containing protein [Candidatus Methanoperedens sp.]MCZ7371340.1 DUF1186 domain-containing protein [Candidatus Methanoperedens sp.]
MAIEKDEDLADLINSHTRMDWDLMMKDMHEISTGELIEGLTALGLYVNKKFAQEIAGREDAVFHIRKLIQDGQYWSQIAPGNRWTPIHAIHILALIKSKNALSLLLDTIRFRNFELYDWLTENVTSLLVAFGEEAIEPLKEFTRDETLESFARGTATTALVILSRNKPSYKNGVVKHLIELLNTTNDITFASLIIQDLARFHDMSVMPEIHRAFEEGRIMEIFMKEEDVESRIKRSDDGDDIKRNTRDPLDHFSRESIESLDDHSSKSEEEDFAWLGEDDPESEMDDETIKREKIGRNEPCPCGSGKKYKKCCMGKEKS